MTCARSGWKGRAACSRRARAGTALRLGAALTSLDVLAAATAEKLLLELAPDRLTPAEAAEMAKLCGCWPLALRLAGALAAVEGADWLLPRLRDERRRLAALQLPGAGGKEESVALAFYLSYEWLAGTDGAAARAFRWLAAFAPAPVEAERLAAVLAWGNCRLPSRPGGWRKWNSGVYRKRAGPRRQNRWKRRRRRCSGCGGRRCCKWRLLPWGLQWGRVGTRCTRCCGITRGRGWWWRGNGRRRKTPTAAYIWLTPEPDADPAAYDALEQARADVLLALDRAYAAQAWAQVRRFVWALGDPASGYLAVRGYWGELRKRLEQAVAAAKAEGDKREVAIFVHNLAIVAQNTGEMDAARQRYAESLAIERELGNRAGMASTLHQLGNIAYLTGEMDVARQRYAESLAIKRELGNRAGMAITLGQLANLERNEGNEAEAERLYREAIEIGRQVGDVAGMSIRMFNLGLLLEKQARLAEAMPLLQQSVDIAERIQFYEAKRWRGVLERVQQKLADHGGAA